MYYFNQLAGRSNGNKTLFTIVTNDDTLSCQQRLPFDLYTTCIYYGEKRDCELLNLRNPEIVHLLCLELSLVGDGAQNMFPSLSTPPF